jgi:hypothetical protein
MFVFFNSRMGCLGSLLTSLIVTLVLIALVGGFNSCGTTGGRDDGGRGAPPSQRDTGGGGDF